MPTDLITTYYIQKQFNTIRLQDEFNRWTIPLQYILENGEFLFFKEQGFEKQIFISLNKIEQFKKKQSYEQM